MNINDFTIQMFNEHDAIMNILIVEPHNQNIYGDKNQEYVAARTSDYNFKLLTVRDILKLEDELYLNIEFKGKKIGILKPQKSIMLIPKNKRQIKVTPEATFDNPVNHFLGIDKKIFEENRTKIAFSKYYALFDGDIYETIILENELFAFLKPSEINNLHGLEKEFSIKEDTVTYRDNGFTKKWKPIKASNKKYTSKHILPQDQKIKFRYGGKNAWIDESCINIDYDIIETKITDINEAIMESILSQYAEKLDDYHIYYNRILAREMKK